jgi:UPF0716 protein FxsA
LPALVVIALIAIPLLELWVILEVADLIGGLATIALLIGVSVAGAWLLKREGAATWRRLQEARRRGEFPTTELADAALLVLGGALLLTPGFVTDVFGLLLLFPGSRIVIKGGMRRLLGVWFFGRLGYAGAAGKAVYDARASRVKRTGEAAPTRLPPVVPPSPPEQTPGGRRDDGDGSPDRG